MKKILIIGESATLSHVGRPFALAKELSAYDYQIHFACDHYFKHLLPKEDLTYHSIKSQDPKIFAHNVNRGLPLYSKTTLIEYINEELKLINEINPDIIIGDFRHTLSISARLSGVPYINIVNAHWSPYHPKYFPFPKNPLTKLMGYSLANQLFNLIKPLIFYMHLRGINSLRKKYHFSPYKSLMEYYTDSEVVLYPDLEGLVPTQNKPQNHHYIGPINFEPKCKTPKWIHSLERNRPIIYFSLGSSGDESALQTIIEVLGETNATVLYSSTKKSNALKFPQNFHVEEFLPGLEICKLSDLIITHGGIPSVYQALSCSVPVVAFATNQDQLKSMHHIETREFGKVIRSDQCNKKYIMQVIQQYQNNTEIKNKISEFMANQTPYQPATIINNIIKTLLS